jgi:AcrR family transcriptional regulator
MVRQAVGVPSVPALFDRLLDVVVDLLVADGYEGISIRRVAAAAGVSIGAVQHHFATKDALLAAAMQRISEQFQERVQGRIGAGTAPGPALRAVADGLLGAGEDERAGTVVWIARLARAAVHEPTAQVHRREWAEVEDLLARLLAAARPDRAATARDDAGALLALLDGLATAQAVEPARMGAERARALLAEHLDRLLGPPSP